MTDDRASYRTGRGGVEIHATWEQGPRRKRDELFKHLDTLVADFKAELEENWSVPRPEVPREKRCDVYWGSHGCGLERGHEGTHWCGCCDCDDVTECIKRTEEDAEDHPGGSLPYYGMDKTNFYGDDA